MRTVLISAMALGAALASPAGAATLLDYSVYSLGNYSSNNGGTTVAGRVAAAGDVRINSENIGGGLTKADNGTATVIAGGNLSYDNSTLKYGNAVYGGSNNSGKWVQAQTPNGSIIQGNPLDFGALNRTAAGYSASLAGLGANGIFSSRHGAGTLTASSGGLNVFNLTDKDLSSLSKLTLVGDSGGKVVINIDASSFSKHLEFNLGGFAADSVLLNFYNATSLDLQGWKLGGSLLAPDAAITLRGGNILGNIVAGDFKSAGANVSGKAYSGYLDAAGISAIPEPETWLMMLAGFTLVGIMLRRRRRLEVASVLS